MEFDGQVFKMSKFSIWAGFSGEAALQDSLGRSPRNLIEQETKADLKQK